MSQKYQIPPDLVVKFQAIDITEVALVGFQGRGFADGVQPDFCHSLILKALIFQ
jgi:hypothetical protein